MILIKQNEGAGKHVIWYSKMNRENHLEVGGCDTVKLAQNSGRRYLFMMSLIFARRHVVLNKR